MGTCWRQTTRRHTHIISNSNINNRHDAAAGEGKIAIKFQRTVFCGTGKAFVEIVVCLTTREKSAASLLQLSKPDTDAGPRRLPLFATILYTLANAADTPVRLLHILDVCANVRQCSCYPRGCHPT